MRVPGASQPFRKYVCGGSGPSLGAIFFFFCVCFFFGRGGGGAGYTPFWGPFTVIACLMLMDGMSLILTYIRTDENENKATVIVQLDHITVHLLPITLNQYQWAN